MLSANFANFKSGTKGQKYLFIGSSHTVTVGHFLEIVSSGYHTVVQIYHEISKKRKTALKNENNGLLD